jgi:hypothetical protein
MQNKESSTFEKQLIARLDIVIRLLLSSSPIKEGQRSIADMAGKLSEMGLSPGEIGTILSKPSNYISATLGSKRKTTTTKGKNVRNATKRAVV